MTEYIAETNAKNKKILKRAEKWLLFVEEAYTLSLTSGKNYAKETIEAMIAKMSTNIDGKTTNNFYICWVSLLSGRFAESEHTSLKTNSEFPAVQRLYTDGICRNHQQNSAYLWNEFGVLDMFVDCFASLPKQIQDINRFRKQDIELGIICFLDNKSNGNQKFSD